MSQIPELLLALLAGQGVLQPRAWVGMGLAKVRVKSPTPSFGKGRIPTP